jgi:hypothetical protein
LAAVDPICGIMMLKYIKCGLTQNPPDQTMQFPAAAAGALASGRKFLAVIAPNLNITARNKFVRRVNVICWEKRIRAHAFFIEPFESETKEAF